MKINEWLNDYALGIDIWHKKYQYLNESFDDWLDRVSGSDPKVKQLIKDKKFLFGGRILANRGLFKYGIRGSYSNCYVLPEVEDSIEGVYKTCAEMARTYSYGGGVGINISNLRPNGCKVNNSAKTTSGAISFMSTFDLVTSTICQQGRRGALMIALDINHPEVENFIDIKTDINAITNANISVLVNDKFMNAVQNDDDYILRYPCNLKDDEIDIPVKYDEVIYTTLPNGKQVVTKKIKAKDLFMKLCKNNWDYAEPGILYIDTISNYNLIVDTDLKYAGVNPCASN